MDCNMSQSGPMQCLSDSDEEVPVVQLCLLPLTEVWAVQPYTTEDFSVLLGLLATGDKKRAHAAVSQIRAILQWNGWDSNFIRVAIEAGGVDILYRALTHECGEISVQAILAFDCLFNYYQAQMKNVCKSGSIETLVELINTNESLEVKRNAINTLASIDILQYRDYQMRVLAAGGITAILSHLREGSSEYMRTVYKALCNLTSEFTPIPCAPYIYEIAGFILSHLNTVEDIAENRYFFCTFSNIVDRCGKEIRLNENICESLIELMGAANQEISISIIYSVTRILLLTSEFTELFIECGLFIKMQELLRSPDSAISGRVVYCLGVMSVQATDIVDKVACSCVIPECISLINANFYSSNENKEVVKLLCNICYYCSSAVIPQLLQMDIANHMLKELFNCEDTTINECIRGLKGIIRYCKEISNPGLFKLYVNAEELTERCRDLVSKGVPAASDLLNLLRDVLWVMSGDKEVEAPMKKHKSAQ